MLRHLKNPTLILITLISIGCFTRFSNLGWGAPYFFHPDERNIAQAISQLSFPQNLNPHFFAYGSLPIYTAFFTGLLSTTLSSLHLVTTISFEQAILILRFFSATLSVLIILLLYSIGKTLKNETVGLIAAFLGATSIGLVQYAHFGTFEMWLTTGSLLMFSFCLRYIKKPHVLSFFGIVFSFAVLLATKVSSLVLLPLLFFSIIFPVMKHKQTKLRIGTYFFLAIILVGIFYSVTNPYVFLDFQSFIDSMLYESAVATGKTKVFYTGEFFQAAPFIFPFIRIYPFLLNPLVFTLFFPALFIVTFTTIKKKHIEYFILLGFFFLLFLSQTVLFAQWTRYFIPTLPFIFLLIAIAIEEGFVKMGKFSSLLKNITLVGIILVSSLFLFAFMKTLYFSPDTRVDAKEWATQRIPASAYILSEVYDLGVVPFNENFYQITLFNFYDLDNNSLAYNEETLFSELEKTEFIILPSQRIQKSRILNADEFPLGNTFYTQLRSGTLGFEKIYETPCDLWCRLVYWGNPIYPFEQTTSIFDRPTISIFTKIR